MTKKTTINKIVGSKTFWIIISLLASFLLWTYIMSTEETHNREDVFQCQGRVSGRG